MANLLLSTRSTTMLVVRLLSLTAAMLMPSCVVVTGFTINTGLASTSSTLPSPTTTSSVLRQPLNHRRTSHDNNDAFRLHFGCSQDEPSSLLMNNRHSASDWWYNVKSIPRSGVLREVKNPVLAVAAWSFVVAGFQKLLSWSSQPTLMALAQKLCIPITAHSFLVSALGLLLVFRTNSSYQRFYEGRKIWENILSISRNLSRMINLYSKEVGHERTDRLMNLLSAYPYLLRHHIRPGCLCEPDEVAVAIPKPYRLKLHEPGFFAVETRHDDDKVCGGVTTVGDSDEISDCTPRSCWVDRRKLPWSLFDSMKSLRKVASAQNRPLWVCDRMGKEVMGIEYGPNFTSRERLTMLGQVEKLTNAVGQCERIRQTGVPLNYARHSLRSLTMWLFTLPFALIKDFGFMTVPVSACVAWLLLGVYQIGYSIEDPFQGSLRLSMLCHAIRRDVVGYSSSSSGDRDHATATETTTSHHRHPHARDSAYDMDETTVANEVAGDEKEAAEPQQPRYDLDTTDLSVLVPELTVQQSARAGIVQQTDNVTAWN